MVYPPNGKHAASPARRVHGAPPTKLYEARDAGIRREAPADATVREVRYTRFCEYGQSCLQTCSMIGTVHSSNNVMLRDTLELEQSDVLRACPYDVHLWVPYNPGDDRCVGIEYITIGDGVRGLFARDTQCTRSLVSPPPPPPLLPPFLFHDLLPRTCLPHQPPSHRLQSRPPTDSPF